MDRPSLTQLPGSQAGRKEAQVTGVRAAEHWARDQMSHPTTSQHSEKAGRRAGEESIEWEVVHYADLSRDRHCPADLKAKGRTSAAHASSSS